MRGEFKHVTVVPDRRFVIRTGRLSMNVLITPDMRLGLRIDSTLPRIASLASEVPVSTQNYRKCKKIAAVWHRGDVKFVR